MSIRNRLENWADAANWGKHADTPYLRETRELRSRIGSMEGRYRPERPKEDAERVPRKIRAEPDFEDADLIDRVWRRMPLHERQLLKWWYVQRAPVGFICRKLGIRNSPMSAFEIQLSKAEKMLLLLLDIPCKSENRRI